MHVNEGHQAEVVRQKELTTVEKALLLPNEESLCPHTASKKDPVITQPRPGVLKLRIESVPSSSPGPSGVASLVQPNLGTQIPDLVILRVHITENKHVLITRSR
jgi:hypothetical protein